MKVLNPRQEDHMVVLLKSGEHSSAEIGDLFGDAGSTVYRAVERNAARKTRRATNAVFDSVKRAMPVAPTP